MSGYQLCPRCEGQKYDVGSCGLCGNSGLLDEDGDAVSLPPGPYREMEPEAFLRLQKAWHERGERNG